MDPTKVNPQVIDVINQVQMATLSPQVVKTSGAAKSYQSVAQSTAIAVQDASDALRNIATLATTAAGVAMAQYLATGDDRYAAILDKSQSMLETATNDYLKVGNAAAEVLRGFPAG